MGILDDLRNEAKRKQSLEDEEKDKRARQDEIFRSKLLPKLRFTYAYLSQVVDYLSSLQPKIEVSHYSREYEELGTLSQHSYRIQSDEKEGLTGTEGLRRFAVRFVCSGEGEFTRQILGTSEIEKKISLLHLHGLSYQCLRHIYSGAPQKYPSATFIIQRKVPVEFAFSGNTETVKLTIKAINHEGFYRLQRDFLPHEVDEKLLDKLCRYMLRENDDFMHVHISDMQRRMIREKLEKQRARETKREPAAAKTDTAVIHRLRHLMSSITKKDR